MIVTQGASNELKGFKLPPGIMSQVAEHPRADILQAIIDGRKFQSGRIGLEPGLEGFETEPGCVRELNNFHGHFHGGAYRSGWMLQLMSASMEKPHLCSQLELLAKDAEIKPVDVRYALGGFSFRYLAESPKELWQQVDATIATVTGQTPQQFGEGYRGAETALVRAQSLLDFLEDSGLQKVVSFETPHDTSHLDPHKIRDDLASAHKVWTESIEPQVMTVYRSLISKGYATKDFWT